MKGRLFASLSGRQQHRELLILALPAVIIVFVLAYLPLGGIVLAFKRFNYAKGIFGSEWVGLKNFEYFFASKNAWRITANTIAYNGAFIVIGTLVSVATAILLSTIGRLAARIYQAILFVPYFVSWVIVGFVAFAFLKSDGGGLNVLLKGIGREPVSWYFTPAVWPVLLLLAYLWKTVGYGCTIYFARLLSIDPTLYEAASIDGASRWQQIVSITLPQLLPLISTLMLLSVGQIFYADFGLFFFVPRGVGALFPVTDVIDTFVFRALREVGDVGMASAVGLYQSMVGFVLVLASNWVARRVNPDYAIF